METPTSPKRRTKLKIILWLFVTILVTAGIASWIMFNTWKKESQRKAIMGNLRHIMSGGLQHLIDTGAKSVRYDELIPTYFQKLEIVDGEDYSHIVISWADGEAQVISTTRQSGDVVYFTF